MKLLFFLKDESLSESEATVMVHAADASKSADAVVEVEVACATGEKETLVWESGLRSGIKIERNLFLDGGNRGEAG